MYKIRLIALLFLLSCTHISHAIAADQFRMISLQYRFAEDVLPMIEPMVGPAGSVRAIDNHLMITTSPERFTQIEALLAQVDVARKNVKITVSHSAENQFQQRGAGVSGRARIDDVTIGSPGSRDGINIDLQDNSTFQSNMGSEFLTVTDGERAFIRVGQSVPYTQQWAMLTNRYLTTGQNVVFQDISTGFAVRPRYIGNQVELEITPRIARRNQAGYVDFEELTTVVRVSPGEWFDLGGSMQNRDDVSREILQMRGGSGSRNSSLKIKVD